MISWCFLMISYVFFFKKFSFEAKPSNITKKSSKNHRFACKKQENLLKSWICIFFQAKR